MDEIALNEEAKRLFGAYCELEKAGDLSGALRKLEAAITIRPTWSELWLFKGQVFRLLKKLDDAQESLSHAISLDPSNHLGWQQLGLVLQDDESYEAAAIAFKEAARICPNKATFTLLANMELTFDLSSAQYHAECALKLDPSWEEARDIRDHAQREIEKSGGLL